MENVKDNTTEVDTNIHVRKITWGPIFAGTLIMIVIMMLLSLLGLGIGLGSIDPLSERQPMEGIGTGAIIWWVVSNLIAVFIGGYVTGKLTSVGFKRSGLLHSLVAWSLYTVISFFILSTTIGAIFSGVGSIVTKSVSTIGSGVGKLIDGKEQGKTDNLFNLQNVVDNHGDASMDKNQMTNILKQVFYKDGTLSTDVQQQDVENAIAQNTKLSADEVSKLSNQTIGLYHQALTKWQDVKQKAEQTADKAASIASKAAIWSFVALLLGAFLAALGGNIGEVKEVYVTNKRY